MNNARRSLFFFGLYMIFGVGVGFIFMPMFILNTFGLSAGDDVWIRFVGLLGSIIGGYYLLIVRAKFDQFIPWTVAMRLYGAAFIVVIVLLGKLGPSMLLFGAIDAAGAVWTWLALRSSSKERSLQFLVTDRPLPELVIAMTLPLEIRLDTSI